MFKNNLSRIKMKLTTNTKISYSKVVYGNNHLFFSENHTKSIMCSADKLQDITRINIKTGYKQ